MSVDELNISHTSDNSISYWPARCADSAFLIDRTTPFVMLRGHMPHRSFEWKWATVPLFQQELTSPVRCRIRALSFDVLLETREFLDMLPRMNGADGLDLVQLMREPPEDFLIHNVKGIPATMQAIVKLKFYLPHDGEPATVCAASKIVLDEAVARLQAGRPRV